MPVSKTEADKLNFKRKYPSTEKPRNRELHTVSLCTFGTVARAKPQSLWTYYHSGFHGKNVLCFGKDTDHFVRGLHIVQSHDPGPCPVLLADDARTRVVSPGTRQRKEEKSGGEGGGVITIAPSMPRQAGRQTDNTSSRASQVYDTQQHDVSL